MDPISNQQFSHDSIKYIYQDSDASRVNPNQRFTKPFVLNAPEKTAKPKKDLNKNEQPSK